MTDENTEAENTEAENTEPPTPYEPRSDDEIKQLAVDLHAGKIFTSNHCQRSEDVRLVFMTTVFMSAEHWQFYEDNNITVLYEYMDKAGPRAINGMPNFFSHNVLSADDWARVIEKVKALEAAIEAL